MLGAPPPAGGKKTGRWKLSRACQEAVNSGFMEKPASAKAPEIRPVAFYAVPGPPAFLGTSRDSIQKRRVGSSASASLLPLSADDFSLVMEPASQGGALEKDVPRWAP